MNLLITAAILISGLTLYSYILMRRAAYIQHQMVIPFMCRVHVPNSMEVLTDREHDIIHDKIDSVNLRTITCFIAALVAGFMGAFFIALVSYGGDGRIIGSIMAVAYAYVLANYNINSSTVGWIREVENDILARIIVNKSEAAGFTSLSAYLEDENKKLAAEYYKEMNELANEFITVAEECGFDPNKEYEASEESFQEYLNIMHEAEKIMREKHPEHAKTYDEYLDK